MRREILNYVSSKRTASVLEVMNRFGSDARPVVVDLIHDNELIRYKDIQGFMLATDSKFRNN